jgi:tetratricopeptide (TPR) repeat protein
LQRADGELGRQLGQDPAATIPKLKGLLDLTGARGAQDPSPAHLDALLADGYWTVGDVTAARAAAAQGLAALTSSDSEGLRRRLQLKAIFLRGQQGELTSATRDYDAAAAQVPDNAPDMACVLIDRGYLRYRMGRMSEAASDLIHAYQLAGERGSEANRMLAATVLSMLYSKNDFRQEALDYTREIIDYDEKSGNRRWLLPAGRRIAGLRRSGRGRDGFQAGAGPVETGRLSARYRDRSTQPLRDAGANPRARGRARRVQ